MSDVGGSEGGLYRAIDDFRAQCDQAIAGELDQHWVGVFEERASNNEVVYHLRQDEIELPPGSTIAGADRVEPDHLSVDYGSYTLSLDLYRQQRGVDLPSVVANKIYRVPAKRALVVAYSAEAPCLISAADAANIQWSFTDATGLVDVGVYRRWAQVQGIEVPPMDEGTVRAVRGVVGRLALDTAKTIYENRL